MGAKVLLSLVVLMGPAATCRSAEDPAPLASTTVGRTGILTNLVLPGSELEAKPQVGHQGPLLVRVKQVFRHGTAFRYDLEFQALEPGMQDLRTMLRRKDGTPTTDLPALPVHVSTLLPAGQVKPHALPFDETVRFGGYRWLVAGGLLIWVGGMVVLLSYGRRRRRETAAAAPPLSLAEKLRPLVESALAGTASAKELADLERSLLNYWRRKLHLTYGDPEQVMKQLRRHPEAGPLLNQLEAWLHQPQASAAVAPAVLLAPYRSLPADALVEQAVEGAA